MHELVARELYEAIEYARSIDEETGKRILIQFEIDQPMFSQTLFNIFPTVIDNQSSELKYQNLAQHFADLAFDVLCVYQKAFGKMPQTFEDNNSWMESQAMLLDKELAPLLTSSHVNDKAAKKMREDFFKPKEGEFVQTGLVEFMNMAVDHFAEESGENYHASLLDLTKTMLFVVIRMFNNLYSLPPKTA
jgi:NTP pyrophosphatase (non-canonical NTP hydrolase)